MSGVACRFEYVEINGEQVPIKVRGPRGHAITDADRQAVADFAALLRSLPPKSNGRSEELLRQED
jgi:hypothetical protein